MIDMNECRAQWAADAVRDFSDATGLDDDLKTGARDLLANLLHLLERQGQDPIPTLERAIGVWASEKADPDGIAPEPRVEIKIAEPAEPIRRVCVIMELHCTASGYVDFPDGKTWADVEDHYVKWGSLRVKWRDGTWQAFDHVATDPDVEWKRPTRYTIETVDDDDCPVAVLVEHTE